MMSLIHWDKSVLTLHVKEIIEDHHHKGDSTGMLGLGVILLGTIAIPAATKFGRPLLKSIIKTGLHLSPQSPKTMIKTQNTSTVSSPQNSQTKTL
ncbi:MAG: hypothetical protein QNJ64_02010 [Crocosphaera sp.]|nr:hypothetical protein [Crocosphaera sp.]